MPWLGSDEQQTDAIVVMGRLASVRVETTDGTLRADRTPIAATRNLGANHAQVIRLVVLPGALPNIPSGLKVVPAIA